MAAVLAYALYNLVYAATGWPAGILSDRRGQRAILATGFGLFAGVYGGLGLATSGDAVWPLFALYGLYMALTDGVSISSLVPAAQRGGALGLFSGVTGGMALLSSLLAGRRWDRGAPSVPFYLGGITAALAMVALLALLRCCRTTTRRRHRDGVDIGEITEEARA